jgi:hypothetical protein
MITKVFLFQFVNSYASFFYLAFVASAMGDCPVTGCMGTLGTNLAIIFGSRIAVGQIKQNLVPYILHQRKLKKEMEKGQGEGENANLKKMTRPEKELLLDEVNICTVEFVPCAEICASEVVISLFLRLVVCTVRPNVVEPGGLRRGGDRLRLHSAFRDRAAHRRLLLAAGQHRGDQDRRLEADPPARATLP